MLLLAGAALGQIFSCDDSTTWSSSFDGRQNPAGAGAGYVEWWFFTAYSASADTGYAMTYDPARKSIDFMLYEHAADPALARVVNLGKSYAAPSVGPANATQTFDAATGVTVLDESTYAIRGAMPEHGLEWSLKYTQAAAAAREHVDLLGVIALDWISYMPSAVVSGYVAVNGTRYDFDADGVGYHDHNSGKWPKLGDDANGLISFDYKWGSINGGAGGVGGVYGAYLLPGPLKSVSVDYVFVRAPGGERVEFGTLCGHHVTFTPLRFVTHADGRKEATAVSIAATSPKYELRWTHEMRSSAANPGGAGLGLVVYEQLSVHNLTLTEKATGRTAAAASGVFGFTEWSGPA